MTSPSVVSALTIAGSDSGGGAGIQADLKTFAAHRVHGLSAIAALTAQHTRGVTAVNVPPMDFLRAQLDACFDDFDIRAVKLGMLATAEVIGVVADALHAHRPAAVIVDPVMVATSGAKLLEDSALQAMRMQLLPLAHVVTPNLPEAELLLGRAIADATAMRQAARDLLALGARAVFLKGGHLPGDADVIDLYCDEDGLAETSHPRLPLEAHGTGCTLSSAIACALAQGMDLADAVNAGKAYLTGALAAGFDMGKGSGPVNHMWNY